MKSREEIIKHLEQIILKNQKIIQKSIKKINATQSLIAMPDLEAQFETKTLRANYIYLIANQVLSEVKRNEENIETVIRHNIQDQERYLLGVGWRSWSHDRLQNTLAEIYATAKSSLIEQLESLLE